MAVAACHGVVRVLVVWQRGRKGGGGRALAFRGGSVSTPARQCCWGIGNGKGGRWRQWACHSVFRGERFVRQQSRRPAVCMLGRCPGGVFGVALEGGNGGEGEQLRQWWAYRSVVGVAVVQHPLGGVVEAGGGWRALLTGQCWGGRMATAVPVVPRR